MFLRLLVLIVAVSTAGARAAVFEVPGREAEMAQLEALFQRHRVLGPDTTLWDPWIPMSVLWLETAQAPATDSLRRAYRERLLRRRIDAEGYVSSQQHDGLAHSEGWPFPLWTQAGGIGWHFSLTGVPYGPESGVQPTTNVTDWAMEGMSGAAPDPARGWTVRVDAPTATLTTPAFRVDATVAPFVRLLWSARGLGPEATVSLEWQTAEEAEFPAFRGFELARAADTVLENSNLPLARHPEARGTLTRFRLRVDRAQPGAEITLVRWFTAVDSRHNINNAVYLQACDDYLRWSGDLAFLRDNLQRMRLALAWAIREFQIGESNVVRTAWVGHDGRSGHAVDGTGRRTLLRGVGVGNNYWDLLPFGGEDALATIYYFDALRRMAALERQVERHPEWNAPLGPLQLEPAELLELAGGLQEEGNERFWNETTGRFVGWRDLSGRAYDYGFSFVNNEAIYYGFASAPHATSIRDWLDGRRIVAGDTSTGPDIYHWRFGPRATTRRNVETYFWGWADPASILFGGQVQDGGAVLGFSFHDLMAVLEVRGPEAAWQRLREVIAWHAEVEKAGGYRAYYAQPGRGSLQGNNTAGGLGMDAEFFESALVPQVMLYGFLGFRPRLDGCLVAPRLPASWPSLTVRGIRLHDVVLDVTAEGGGLRVKVHGEPRRPLRLFTPGGDDAQVSIREGTIEVARPQPR